ncbi:MAG: sterol desaturase family protein [Aureispira sp.]|nr:sterol desaturase family protein [Aureispira sp.]
MSWQNLLFGTGISFLSMAIIFSPMERVFSANPKQKLLRPAWQIDCLFFLGQYLLWSSLVLHLLWHLKYWLYLLVPTEFRNLVSMQAWSLQVLEILLVSDFLVYWGHRLQHKFDFLWSFHKVHHSAEHLDWLAAHREHPLDALYTTGIVNLPAFIIGFPLETIAGIIVFRGFWAIYIHSNIHVPIAPLHLILGSPRLHRWHHSKDRTSTNFSNLFPILDIIFGTYKPPNTEPKELGIDEAISKHYLGLLLSPFFVQKDVSNKDADN